MRIRLVVLVVACSVGELIVSGVATAQVQKKKPAAVFETPEKGAKVAQIEQVEGRLETKEGWPVVLVRPTNVNQWWAQPVVEKVEDDRRFACSVTFGNEGTSSGTKYRLVIIVVKSKSEAESKFPAGKLIESLPPSLPRSDYLNVERE
jgi:hypothetical protein